MGLFDRFRIPSVDPAAAREMIAAGATLLDVRDNAEWNAGHAPAAVHVPLGRIADAPRRVKKGRPVVVVCRSGNRSRTATKALLDAGLEAYNLVGGMRAWASSGGAVVDRANRPGRVI